MMKSFTLSKLCMSVAAISLFSFNVAAKDQPLSLGLVYSVGPDIWRDADSRDLPFPVVTFRHGNWYGVDGNYGYNFVQDDGFELGLNLNARIEGFDTDDAKGVLKQYDDNDPALEAGVRAAYDSRSWGALQLVVSTDVSGTHDGNAAQFKYSYRLGNKSVSLTPFVAATYRSSDLVEYYYGISKDDLKGAACSPSEIAKGYCTLYPGDDTWSYTLGSAFSYRFAKNWSMIGNLQIEYYGSDIKNSPLVNEDSGVSGSIGVAYTF